jgi:hypothetical protein
MIDEPTVIPVSPGAAVARLSQVAGALQKNADIAAALPSETAAQLRSQRDALLQALENDAPHESERHCALHRFRCARFMKLYRSPACGAWNRHRLCLPRCVFPTRW